jgi:hypothetical protein
MRGKLTVLMITAFVDMLGLAMVIPLLSFYAWRSDWRLSRRYILI